MPCGIWPSGALGSPVRGAHSIQVVVVLFAPSQSNVSIGGPIVDGPPLSDVYRNLSRFYKKLPSGLIVPATEPLHGGWDPFLDPGQLYEGYGLAAFRFAIDKWLDAHQSAIVIVVPRGRGSSVLETSWQWNPESQYTQQSLDDLIAVLRPSYYCVGMDLRGESEALIGGTDASDYAAHQQAWMDHARVRAGRAKMPWLIANLPSPDLSGYPAWSTVQAQRRLLAQSDPLQIVVEQSQVTPGLHYPTPYHQVFGEVDLAPHMDALIAAGAP